MSRTKPLHVWDVGNVEITYACGADPEQPAICAVISSLHMPSVLRLDEPRARICAKCRAVVRERLKAARSLSSPPSRRGGLRKGSTVEGSGKPRSNSRSRRVPGGRRNER